GGNHMNRLFLCAGAVLMLVSPAFGQLYLITGSPLKDPETFPSSLVRVAADGSLKIVKEIVLGDIGEEWMAVSHDARKAVILPKWPDEHVIVLDFDSAAVKSCQRPQTVGLILVEQWLVDLPSHGLTVAFYRAAQDRRANEDQILGMITDPTVSCEDS